MADLAVNSSNECGKTLTEVVHWGLICNVTCNPLAGVSSNESTISHTACGQRYTCSKFLAALLGASTSCATFFFPKSG